MAVILFRIIMLLSLYQKWTAPAIKDPAASNEVFDSRGSRQISMQAWILGSLLAGIKSAASEVSEAAFFLSYRACRRVLYQKPDSVLILQVIYYK